MNHGVCLRLCDALLCHVPCSYCKGSCTLLLTPPGKPHFCPAAAAAIEQFNHYQLHGRCMRVMLRVKTPLSKRDGAGNLFVRVRRVAEASARAARRRIQWLPAALRALQRVCPSPALCLYTWCSRQGLHLSVDNRVLEQAFSVFGKASVGGQAPWPSKQRQRCWRW